MNLNLIGDPHFKTRATMNISVWTFQYVKISNFVTSRRLWMSIWFDNCIFKNTKTRLCLKFWMISLISNKTQYQKFTGVYIWMVYIPMKFLTLLFISKMKRCEKFGILPFLYFTHIWFSTNGRFFKAFLYTTPKRTNYF